MCWSLHLLTAVVFHDIKPGRFTLVESKGHWITCDFLLLLYSSLNISVSLSPMQLKGIFQTLPHISVRKRSDHWLIFRKIYSIIYGLNIFCRTGENTQQKLVDNVVFRQILVTNTYCMKILEWFRMVSTLSKWATPQGRCAADCARKPTTWHAAGSSTTIVCRTVHCPPTLASGWRLLVCHSAAQLNSNSIDENAVSVRYRFCPFSPLIVVIGRVCCNIL